MRYISSLCLLICCIWLSGCQTDENLRSANETGLLITLTDESDHAYARTMPSALEKPVADMFHLRVAYSGTDNVAYDDKCTESILLKEGTYDLTATYGENPVIALDAPYYIGKLESQEVVTGQMTSANISCMVGNALLSVIYNESALKKVYDTYFVTVSVDQESVDLDATSGKSAYFQAGSSVSLVFHGQLAGTGQEVSYDIPAQEKFANIPAKTHVKVTLGVDESSVSSGVGISVEKLETETVSVVETLPSKFMPKPKLEAEGFVNNELSFAETEKKTAVIRLKLASPLQDLKLKFHSTDEKFAGLEAEKEYVLSNAEDKAAIETALGITLPEIGATEGSLDFSSLTPQLMTDAGNTVSSTIEVDVKANNRWASEDEAANRVYTLKCNKPIFHVSVYPGNIWTKEFTMNPLIAEEVEAGDYEVLSKNIRYQFSTNENGDWSDLDSGLRKADLTPGTTYYVRGFYRDGIYSDVVAVTTYSPIQLENGDMEKWSYEDGPEGNFWDRGPFWKRWYLNDSKDDSQEGWCSLNGLTTSDWDAKAYVSNSGTERTTDCHEGQYAAEIKTIGWGSGTTAASPISWIKTITPGELYLGKLENNTPIYGISFKSKPTKLNFYYKYIPDGDHKFKVKLSLKNGDRIIAEKEFDGEQSDTYTPMSLDFGYHYEDNPDILKYDVLTLCVQFISGDNSKSEVDKASVRRGSRHVGNKLYIDDISLVYDK